MSVILLLLLLVLLLTQGILQIYVSRVRAIRDLGIY